MNKSNNSFVLLKPMEGDEEEHVFRRATIKILRKWREGNLPEMTEWAS